MSGRNEERRKVCTGYTNAIDVFWNDAATFNDLVQLRSSSMEDDGVEADANEKTEAKSEFIKLPEDGTADFYDCKLGRLGGVRG
jgi:hypothetical protein